MALGHAARKLISGARMTFALGDGSAVAVLSEAVALYHTARIVALDDLSNGMSDAMLYKWKAKYGGMTVSELRRLKDLEAETAELKRLLVDAMLDNAGLTGLLAKSS